MRGATRGDGVRGEDVTAERPHDPGDSAARSRTRPPGRIEVRGEVYLPRASFARINVEREDEGEPLVRESAQRRRRDDAEPGSARW